MALFSKLEQLVHELQNEVCEIPMLRQEQLKVLRNYIAENNPARLNFICTHNSRRSHLGMIWAIVAAHYHGLDQVESYSGGTEATALNPRMVVALARAGFRIDDPGGENPHYLVHFSADAPPLICFSKRYDDSANPSAGFAAIMTCSEADENCPLIFGADLRLPLTYEDPKLADDTPAETARYDERLRQIGREVLFAFGSE